MRESFTIVYHGEELFSNQLNGFFPVYSTNVLPRQPQLFANFPVSGAICDQSEVSTGFSQCWFIAQFIRYSINAFDEYVMEREASGMA